MTEFEEWNNRKHELHEIIKKKLKPLEVDIYVEVDLEKQAVSAFLISLTSAKPKRVVSVIFHHERHEEVVKNDFAEEDQLLDLIDTILNFFKEW